MKRKPIICGILIILCMLISVGNAENHVDGKALLEEILYALITPPAIARTVPL